MHLLGGTLIFRLLISLFLFVVLPGPQLLAQHAAAPAPVETRVNDRQILECNHESLDALLDLFFDLRKHVSDPSANPDAKYHASDRLIENEEFVERAKALLGPRYSERLKGFYIQPFGRTEILKMDFASDSGYENLEFRVLKQSENITNSKLELRRQYDNGSGTQGYELPCHVFMRNSGRAALRKASRRSQAKDEAEIVMEGNRGRQEVRVGGELKTSGEGGELALIHI